MNIFQLRDQIIHEYIDYTSRFRSIRNRQIADFVQTQLAQGRLCPTALIQRSPAYETDVTIAN